MIKVIFVVVGLAALGHWRRYGLRQAWYVLRTGDKDPDFEAIDAVYFLGRKAYESHKSSNSEIRPTL